jgi:hypothetical protein
VKNQTQTQKSKASAKSQALNKRQIQGPAPSLLSAFDLGICFGF